MFVFKKLKFVRTKDSFFIQKKNKSKYFEKIFKKLFFCLLKFNLVAVKSLMDFKTICQEILKITLSF